MKHLATAETKSGFSGICLFLPICLARSIFRFDTYPSHIVLYIESQLQTILPLKRNSNYTPIPSGSGRWLKSPSNRHARTAASLLLHKALGSCHVSFGLKHPHVPRSCLHHAGPLGSVLRPKPRNRPLMVLRINHQTPRVAIRPPRQASSHKSFSFAAWTDYSSLPCTLTWSPRLLRLHFSRLRLALLAPCELYLIPLSTGSIEPSLLFSPLLGGHSGKELSRLFFTCNNANQAASYTCSTRPRVSPHNVVNHSS